MIKDSRLSLGESGVLEETGGAALINSGFMELARELELELRTIVKILAADLGFGCKESHEQSGAGSKQDEVRPGGPNPALYGKKATLALNRKKPNRRPKRAELEGGRRRSRMKEKAGRF